MKRFSLGLVLGAFLVPFSTNAVAFLMQDVAQDDWYGAAVYRLQDYGILQGYPDGTFQPEKPVSRAELAAVIDRTITAIRMLDTTTVNPATGSFRMGLPVDEAVSAAQARDAKRRSDVNTILNALYQRAIDHDGSVPSGITTTPREICRSVTYACNGMVRLFELESAYLVRLPVDPNKSADDGGTGYFISRNSTDDRLVITAPLAETVDEIMVTR